MKIVQYPREDFIEFTDDMVAAISLALLNSGISGECQQCHRGMAKIIPGGTLTVWQNHGPSANILYGPNTFCAMTICDHCGHKEEYDLQRLGLLEKFMPFFNKVLEQDEIENEK